MWAADQVVRPVQSTRDRGREKHSSRRDSHAAEAASGDTRESSHHPRRVVGDSFGSSRSQPFRFVERSDRGGRALSSVTSVGGFSRKRGEKESTLSPLTSFIFFIQAKDGHHWLPQAGGGGDADHSHVIAGASPRFFFRPSTRRANLSLCRSSPDARAAPLPPL